MRGCQVADPAVQVQTELPEQNIVGRAQPFHLAALLKHRQVKLWRIAAEDLPRHLDIAVARNLDGRRRRGLSQGEAERPAAENVPLCDPRPRLQADQLLAGLRRKPELLDAHGRLVTPSKNSLPHRPFAWRARRS